MMSYPSELGLRRGLAVVTASCVMLASFGARAYQPCGELRNSFGPLDYRTASAEDKRLVEGTHFLPETENLIRGETSRGPAPDIDYTLRAFPNHPRALLSMMKLSQKVNKEKPAGSRYTMHCWFDRAIRFAPNDGSVRLLHGIYLSRKGEHQVALQELDLARERIGEDPNLQYNLGLAYFDLKQYDKSLEHAQKAYKLGFPLPGLRNKLQQAGKWRDPVASSPETDRPKPTQAEVQR
jgi:tetratricopeptide (TPR) repeat protein